MPEDAVVGAPVVDKVDVTLSVVSPLIAVVESTLTGVAALVVSL